jgi:hypothetical protein
MAAPTLIDDGGHVKTEIARKARFFDLTVNASGRDRTATDTNRQEKVECARINRQHNEALAAVPGWFP